MPFIYPKKRSNPKIQRLGSKGFSDGWNSLPNPSSLKDSELAELINGIYSQYGSISKRQGSQLLGERPVDSTKVINAGIFYDIGDEDYMLRITDLGTVERYNFTNNTWALLTGTPPAGYSDNDPEFVDDSPIFDTSVFINMVQVQGKIYFASSLDRVTIFDGTDWKVYVELADPTTRPTVVKTGADTGTRTYYYRYADLNEFGTSLASPANDGGQSNGDGFYEDMPEIDGANYLTITLPAPAAGTTRRMLFRGDVAGNEFFLADMEADQLEYVDKNVNPVGLEGTSVVFATPLANTTPGYHFYLLATYANSLVGTTVEEGADTLVWSAGDDKFDSFALPDGAGFDGYEKGDGQTINALQPFSVANKDGLAVFKDRRMGLLEFDLFFGYINGIKHFNFYQFD